jgi:cytochrome c oxidase subunit II
MTPVFNPSSPQAAPIFTLFVFVLIACVVILALVTSLVVYACFRYRRRSGEGDPPQRFGSQKLEIAWTVAPFLLLVAIFIFTARAMSSSDPTPGDASSPDVVIVGHQWWWKAQYPKGGFRTANEIHLPAGQNMGVLIKTNDVIHDFWVPQLARKVDAIPGFPNYLLLHPDRSGVYLGACSEFCGEEHAWMRFHVVVTSQPEFEMWERRQVQAASAPAGPLASQGARLFQEKTCMKCHTISGTNAKGQVGPDLTHFLSRQRFAGERLDNTQENVARWLKNPQEIKPGCHMPNMQLTDDEVKLLTAYLEGLQ